jgi:hypothetical protein
MLDFFVGWFFWLAVLILGPMLLVEAFTTLRNWYRTRGTEKAPEPWTYPVTPADPSLPLYNAPSAHTQDRGRALRGRHYRALKREARNYYGFFLRKRGQ